MASPLPILIPDERRIGERMAVATLHLPEATINGLDRLAAAHRVSRAAMVRTLLARELEQLLPHLAA